MTIPEAILSGFLQGVTEFLPISSSGHLVLLHGYFGLSEPQVLFDLFLHLGTLGAVLVYFSGTIIKLIRERRFSWLVYIAAGTVPAVGAALLFEDRITSFFAEPGKVAYMLIVTGVVLFAGQAALVFRKPQRDLNVPASLGVGLAQAFALLPGISRSGVTVSAGLGCGVRPREAFDFAFLLSIPAVLGGVLFQVFRVDSVSMLTDNKAAFFSWTLTAFAAGLASLPVLWHILKRRKLYIFGIYCLCLGAYLIIF